MFDGFGTLVTDDRGMRFRVRGTRRSRYAGNPMHYLRMASQSEDYENAPGEFAGNPLHYLNVAEHSEDAHRNSEAYAGYGDTLTATPSGTSSTSPDIGRAIGTGISAIGTSIATLFGGGSTSGGQPPPQQPNSMVPLLGLGLAGVALFMVMSKKKG